MPVRSPYFKIPNSGNVLIYRYKLDDGKSYIGQTRQNLADRHYKHRCCSVYPIDIALKSHSYELTVLCEVPIEDGDTMERFYVEKFNSVYPNGYNLTTGGIKDSKGCELYSQHLSESLIGKPKSPEHKAKINKNNEHTRFKKGQTPWNKGITIDSEAYDVLKPTMFKKGQVPWNKGKKYSDETRKKISEAGKGRIPPNRISIRCVETGKTYKSLTEASNEEKIPLTQLSRCLKGKLNYCNGKHWEKVI